MDVTHDGRLEAGDSLDHRVEVADLTEPDQRAVAHGGRRVTDPAVVVLHLGVMQL